MREMVEMQDERFVAAMNKMARHEEVRHEMLWLRAMERQELDDALLLERIDPGLCARLADVRAAAEALDPESARELYQRARDERLERELGWTLPT